MGDVHIVQCTYVQFKVIKATVYPYPTGYPRCFPELEGFAVGVPAIVNKGVIRPSKFVVAAVFNDPSPFVIATRSTQFTESPEVLAAVQLMSSASMNIPVAAGSATVSARCTLYTEGSCSIVSNRKFFEFVQCRKAGLSSDWD